jgi:hypothetical protein
MAVLREALGERLWHNKSPRACFIIDDPLLTKRYGCLEYERLSKISHRHKFSACIAFIPWNYRRSSDEVLTLFSSEDSRLSLCVHGCDHLGGEFATADFQMLSAKAQLALERMRSHERISGVPFDDVMVFPQGMFSAEGVKALKVSGYLASVNGALCPSTIPDALVLRDLLEPAHTHFYDFPLFSRRYPRDIADFAVDLFLGKPILAVEHHGYFRNGYQELETFVRQVNALDSRLEWTSLGTVCSSACLTRIIDEHETQVRFYTTRFRLTNDGPEVRRYVLIRRHPRSEPVSSVIIDGRRVDVELKEDSLAIRLSLDAGHSAIVEVLSSNPDFAPGAAKSSRFHNVRVLVRRGLSEFRDNHVTTSGGLGRVFSALRSFRTVISGGIADSNEPRRLA